MIWYLGLLISAMIAWFLAWRSMRDFQEEVLNKEADYELFLISNTQKLTQPVFSSLIDSLKGYIFSFEIVQKGNGVVLIGFFPRFIKAQFPSLGLLEIEDYILGSKEQVKSELAGKQITVDDSFTWTLKSKKSKQKLDFSLKLENKPFKKSNFKFELDDDQYAAWQVVSIPSEDKLQITPRLIVRETSPQRKIELIKQVKKTVELQSSLINSPSLLHAGVYEDYKNRSLIPKQVISFSVSREELYQFLHS